MKPISFPLVAAVLATPALTALADSPARDTAILSTSDSGKGVVVPQDPHHFLARPDAHAPLGVMFDHAHSAGQFMLGYRYILTRDTGLLQGGDSISRDQVYRTKSPGGSFYTAAPVDMDMHMHMAEIMWAPADWITLMVMPMYMEMNMTMESRGGAGRGHAHGHGHGHGNGHGHGHGTETSTFTHGTTGWGDTNLSALIPYWESGSQQALLILGVNAPTGSVDQGVHGRFTHYMMQLGSGTWDLRPGLNYAGNAGLLSWGGQAIGTFRLEDENASGYQLGNVIDLTAWAAYKLCDALSVSGRLAWRTEGEIEGHYHGPHNHDSPPDFQSNHGGNRLDAGLGFNFIMPRGFLQGHRLAVEALVPLHQEVNGIQLERDWTLFAGWQYAF